MADTPKQLLHLVFGGPYSLERVGENWLAGLVVEVVDDRGEAFGWQTPALFTTAAGDYEGFVASFRRPGR